LLGRRVPRRFNPLFACQCCSVWTEPCSNVSRKAPN